MQVWEQIRKGWYGDSTRGQGRRGVGKRPTVASWWNMPSRRWISGLTTTDRILSGSMRALVVPQSHSGSAPGYKGVVEDDGVDAQEALELSGEVFGVHGPWGRRREYANLIVCMPRSACVWFLICAL